MQNTLIGEILEQKSRKPLAERVEDAIPQYVSKSEMKILTQLIDVYKFKFSSLPISSLKEEEQSYKVLNNALYSSYSSLMQQGKLSHFVEIPTLTADIMEILKIKPMDLDIMANQIDNIGVNFLVCRLNSLRGFKHAKTF